MAVALVVGLLAGIAIGGMQADPGDPPAAPEQAAPGQAAPDGTAPDEDEGGNGDPQRPRERAVLDPNDRSDTEAALRGGWPLVSHDEFDGTALDTSLWEPYSGKTTGGVGRHDPANLAVSDGTLKLTSRGYKSAGMAWGQGQQYGRWETRARAQAGNGYSAVILLWPDAEDFPVGGEIDFMEIPDGARQESHFVLHYGKKNSQIGVTTAGDFTDWHTYAVEWTPDHVAGFIDGQQIFRSDDKAAIPPRPMHLAIQQDIGPFGNGWVPALDDTTPDQVQLEVDWVRIYGL